jgi:rod shape-determining protein MreB and related proteins
VSFLNSLAATLYIQFDEKNLRIFNVKKDIWAEKHLQSLEVNPFAHPRVVLADIHPAIQVIADEIKKVLPLKERLIKPILVLHPLRKLEGGLTQVERQVLSELSMRLGAAKVFLWDKEELSREELLRLN